MKHTIIYIQVALYVGWKKSYCPVRVVNGTRSKCFNCDEDALVNVHIEIVTNCVWRMGTIMEFSFGCFRACLSKIQPAAWESWPNVAAVFLGCLCFLVSNRNWARSYSLKIPAKWPASCTKHGVWPKGTVGTGALPRQIHQYSTLARQIFISFI